MSLGQEIAPHLPFLRRYARALLGSQGHADAFVTHVIRRIVDDPAIMSSFENVRIGLYTLLHDAVHDPPDYIIQEDNDGDPTKVQEDPNVKITFRRLGQIASSDREALLLTTLEGFSSDHAALITGTSPEVLDTQVATALAEIERQTKTKVLIIEDEPIIAMDLEIIVRDLGLEVVGVAVTKDDALKQATDDVGLLLVDIQLADDSSGIEAAEEIVAKRKRPVIFITAFPERLVKGTRLEPTFLITKPFERSTVKAAIAQALFFDAATLPPEEPPEAIAPASKKAEPGKLAKAISPDVIPPAQLVPRLAPVDAKVHQGQLKLVQGPVARTSLSSKKIEEVRELHRGTALRIRDELRMTNVGPGPIERITSIADTLSKPITEAGGVRLGIQAAGLIRLLDPIAEVVDETRFMDLRIFVDDVVDLARQFGAYRQFIDEARSFETVTEQSESSLSKIAVELAKQPDEIVEPELKGAITELISLTRDVPDPLSRFALFRAIGNVLRAIGRWINERFRGAGSEANKALDKTIGTLVVTLGLGGAAYWISQLVISHPQEFFFLMEILRFAKSLAG
jgi:CheY-like chemotaxis protein